MQTRLSLFCQGMIEAVTLAAVVLVSLFFNVTFDTAFGLLNRRALAYSRHFMRQLV